MLSQQEGEEERKGGCLYSDLTQALRPKPRVFNHYRIGLNKIFPSPLGGGVLQTSQHAVAGAHGNPPGIFYSRGGLPTLTGGLVPTCARRGLHIRGSQAYS